MLHDIKVRTEFLMINIMIFINCPEIFNNVLTYVTSDFCGIYWNLLVFDAEKTYCQLSKIPNKMTSVDTMTISS